MTAQHHQLRERDSEETTETPTTQDCPECGGQLTADDAHAETTCKECGLVVDEQEIDRGPEWRAFTKAERDQKSRVGAPTTQTLHDKGLTTNIGWRDKDAHGSTLSAEKRSQINRLRKWQERIRTKEPGERNLQFALSEIERMASALGVPNSVCEVAAVIYRRALDEDLIRGRSIEGIATATLYAACRKQGLPRSLDEIDTVSRVGTTEVGRTYRHLSEELALEIEPTSPTQYLPRFCSALDVSEEVEAQANEIIERTAADLLSGKSPPGYAGAAIYTAGLLCNEKRTQKEVAEVAEVTEVTIRNRYQEQLELIENREGVADL